MGERRLNQIRNYYHCSNKSVTTKIYGQTEKEKNFFWNRNCASTVLPPMDIA